MRAKHAAGDHTALGNDADGSVYGAVYGFFDVIAFPDYLRSHHNACGNHNPNDRDFRGNNSTGTCHTDAVLPDDFLPAPRNDSRTLRTA